MAQGLIINKMTGIIGLSGNQIKSELDRLGSRFAGSNSFAVKNQKVVSVDLGVGLFAGAQREILAVLINEPGLFESVKGKISIDMFDAPILREIAEVVFESLVASEKASLVELTGRLESTEAGAAIIELAQAGAEKGDCKERLGQALTVIAVHRENIEKSRMTGALADDDTESLREIGEILSRTNRRNPGMMPA